MADKIEWGIPSVSFYTHYPIHATKGKRYKVTNGDFLADTGDRISALFEIGNWLVKVPYKNVVGGELL